MISIFWSDRIKPPNYYYFALFLQGMANRLLQGYCRYGPPDRRFKYMDRMSKELTAYRKTGNMEHLINIANWAHLESFCPQNKKFHYDPTAPSATRTD